MRAQRPSSSARRWRCSFPIDWPEPFGLAMIEAMACGTPVLAFRRGSVPEVIDEGVTGMIVESMEEAVGSRAARARRSTGARCARRFDQRFTATRMAKEYVQTYRAAAASRSGLIDAGGRATAAAGTGRNARLDRDRMTIDLRACQRSTILRKLSSTSRQSAPASRPRRTLKHGDTFVVFDQPW